MSVKITFNAKPNNGDFIRFKRNGVVQTLTYLTNYAGGANGGIDIMDGNYSQASRAMIIMPLRFPFLNVQKEGVYVDYRSPSTGAITISSADGSVLSDFEVSSSFATVSPQTSATSVINNNGTSVVVLNPVDVLPVKTPTVSTPTVSTPAVSTPAVIPSIIDKITSLVSTPTAITPSATVKATPTTTSTSTITKSNNTKYWIFGLLILVSGYFVIKSKKIN